MSDNKELINRQANHKTYQYPYPNQTLKAEFDLTEQTYMTHKAYNIIGTFNYVYGHQDNNDDYMKVPLDTQLNIEANALAELYYTSGGKQSTAIAHILPSSPAMLTINGITTSNNYKTQLI